MRHLAPHPEPAALAAARPALPPNWENLGRRFPAVKRAIRELLYVWQYGLCGYCEASLADMGRHIEHIEPKAGIGGNPARTYDYSNLIASCQGDTQRAVRDGQDSSCGHHKDRIIGQDGVFRLADFISPREPGCDSMFRYLIDGRVVPRDAPGTPGHARATYTIHVAGLDCLRLRNRRRQIADRTTRQVQRFINQPAIVQTLINHYLATRVDTAGTPVLLPHYSTRRQRFFP